MMMHREVKKFQVVSKGGRSRSKQSSYRAWAFTPVPCPIADFTLGVGNYGLWAIFRSKNGLYILSFFFLFNVLKGLFKKSGEEGKKKYVTETGCSPQSLHLLSGPLQKVC